ncbi:baseplate J/gp47 family protein [Microbacterium sp. BK668]|uniref:baseplate J/gp47 family protein n=1 Tax=Microbacterium sp. BK668 TaxID=2512118 RepID=UPI00105EEB39|nr:baseplate J/gp47 family protein [Microbacterium sp. BK668]TDN90912.1 putative phage baseplate assembly protein [Microbacterium sp. BK668]
MPDRLTDLVASTTLNGIDFVEIGDPAQTLLRVHFLNTVTVEGTLAATTPVRITGGETVAAVPVEPIGGADWTTDDAGRPVLTVRTPFPGDFSHYRLSVASTALDPFFATILFTFKAGCPSTLDCADDEECEPDDTPAPAIDYLAKDFTSLRAALLDYTASAYPRWVERDEPDVGMMLVELLSAAGDDLSYLQDRITGESALATATQQVSAVRHARLVDYEPTPATSAETLVQIDVAFPGLARGLTIGAGLPDGSTLPFELGGPLLDPDSGALRTDPLAVDPRWNRFDRTGPQPVPRILPYWWDDAVVCLPAGSTELWVRGHGYSFPIGDPREGTVGLAVLLDTAAPTAADPTVREVVHLTGAAEEVDPLYGIALTHLTWDAGEALAVEHALDRTVLAGNLVAAVEGQRYTERFVIEPDPGGPDAPLAAVVRSGPDAGCDDATPQYLHTLEAGTLAWVREGSARLPEIAVVELPETAGDTATIWRWRRTLLDADLFEQAYTVDPVVYRDLRRSPRDLPWFEYDGDDGDSVRFGDGVFGELPPTGARFEVTYRTTAGATGNVAADAVTIVGDDLAGIVLSATNPFPAAGGEDRESIAHIRDNAPYAFRARQFRAVRAEDYTATAKELPWVLDAGTRVRWTGSWLSVFTTAQPPTGEAPSTGQTGELVELLDRRRLAGYDVHTPAPRYVGLDLVVTVCALPGARRGEVEEAVLDELGTGRTCDGRLGFFAPGRLRFGAPLERSELEASVQRASGVDGVVSVRYRRRGHVPWYRPMPEVVSVGLDEILRADNDANRPDRGSIRVVVKGVA